MTAKHGTNNRYIHGPDEHDVPGNGCRCTACRRASARVRKSRKLAILTGTHNPMVCADLVRAHVRSLMAAGLGAPQIARLAGISYGTVNRILFASPPVRMVMPRNAVALLAVSRTALSGDAAALVSAVGSTRRLQALAVAGWPAGSVAAEVGVVREVVLRIANPRPGQRVTVATACRVREVHDRLWDLDPLEHGVSVLSVNRTRKLARAKGWLPSASWDDDLIDLGAVDLAAELSRQVAEMGDDEVRRCHTACYKHKDLSPLVVAGAHEWRRRTSREKRQAAA